MAATDMLAPLLPDPLPAEPFALFRQWFDEAAAVKAQPNPNAMALATVSPEGQPAVRIVLCKGIDPGSGHIVFYTNYTSDKGRALGTNPSAEALFHWDAMDRQVRIRGPVVKSPASESDAYFATRPWMSQIGAWASQQSRPIASRADLVAQLAGEMARFGVDLLEMPREDVAMKIPRPPHWGGYRLHAERVELWAGSEARLHDRAAWTRSVAVTPETRDQASQVSIGPWSVTRLQP